MKALHTVFPTLICLLISLLPLQPLAAQDLYNDSVLIRKYDSRDGASGVVVDFYLDQENVLWMAHPFVRPTRFDGKRFQRPDTVVSNQISFMEKYSISQKKEGQVTMYFKGFPHAMKLNAAGKFEAVAALPEKNFIERYPFYFDRDAFIRAGSKASTRSNREAIMSTIQSDDRFRPFDDSTFIYADSSGKYHLYHQSEAKALALDEAYLNRIVKYKQDFLLIDKKQLCSFDPENGRIELLQLSGDILKADKLFKGGKNDLYDNVEIHPGKIPHLVMKNSLYRLSRLALNSYATTFICDLSFLHKRLAKIEYYQHLDMTVMASLTEGLFIVQKNHFYPKAFSPQFKLQKHKKVYYPISTDDRGNFRTLWSSFSPYQNHFKPTDFNGKVPFGQYIDKAGRWWLTGHKTPVLLYDSNLHKTGQYTLPKPSIASVDFCEDEAGELYCLGNKSLMKMDQGQFRTMVDCDSFPNKLMWPNFQNISYMGNGKFFMGAEKGLFLYDRNTQTLVKNNMVGDGYVLNNIALDKETALFSIYPNDNLVLYYRQQYFTIPVGNIPAMKQVEIMQADSLGRVWFATDNGLYVTTIEELKLYCDGKIKSVFFYAYNTADGLPVTEFAGGLNPSSAISKDGWLAFNSLAGLVIFHQDSIRQVFPAPFIQVMKPGEKGGTIGGKDSLFIANDQQTVSLATSIAYYGNRDNIKLEYALDGSDEWQPVKEDNLVLERLDNGNHTLTIRLKTGFGAGESSYYYRTIPVVVHPFFYQTIGFTILLVMSLFGFAVFIGSFSYRLHKKKAIIREKNAEIVVKNKSLESKSKELAALLVDMKVANQQVLESKEELQDTLIVKERLMSLILHDLRSPLHSQSILLERMINTPDLDIKEIRDIHSKMKTSNDSILKFTRDFLTWYSSQKSGFTVNNELFSARELIENILEVYKDMAAIKGITLSYPDGDINIFSDRNILEIILRNILDNALKYTKTGQVSIAYGVENNLAVFSIKDTGPGIKPEILELIKNIDAKDAQYELQTFGYRFIIPLSKKISAQIKIQNNEDQGTTVSLVIPSPEFSFEPNYPPLRAI